MASTSRFREVSEDDIESVLQSAIPEKTKQSTKYGIKIFKDWFSTQKEITTPIEQQTKAELNTCLQKFYVSVRRTNGEPFKVSSLKAIREAIDRHLKQAPNNKPWSIVGDLEFKKANDTLNADCKNLMKEGKVAGVVHKTPITSEQLQKLFESGQLGNADTKDPKQLQRTAWFYTYLYFVEPMVIAVKHFFIV
ncbi:hypothetical protein ACROYT_G041346 [Oculina patagonica]